MRRGLLIEMGSTEDGRPFVIGELYVAYARRGRTTVRLARLVFADTEVELVERYRTGGVPLGIRKLHRPITNADRDRFKRMLRRRWYRVSPWPAASTLKRDGTP